MPGTPAGDVPPVPVHLSQCPAEGGLVVPYISLRHANGRAAFGLIDSGRIATCLRERRCGVCGQEMTDRMVFLMRRRDLDRECSSEPGMCPPCAGYAIRACPMISGQMDHYRRSQPQFLGRMCDDPLCLCWMWYSRPEPARYGAPAEPWFSLWTRAYRIVRPPEGGIAAGFADVRILAVRPVPQPGAEQER